MAVLSPRLFRRGLEAFAAISVVVLAGLLFYGNNLDLFLHALLTLDFRWLLVGVGLASLDWFGGGLRLYVVARHLYREQSLSSAILAGGLNTWGAMLTPSQTGGGPIMIYVLKRYGTPLPEAMISSLMTFIATVVFFALAGPVALVLGAGRSLSGYGVIGRAFSLFDLFRLSLGGFLAIGLGIVVLIAFPGIARHLAAATRRVAERRGKTALAARIGEAEAGVDRAHAAVKQFATPTGLMASALCVVLSAVAHANKLVAGWVVLRMLRIEVNFTDVVLLQTLITFLLYFAPTPGGSGLAEILSAAVMSIYVPRELTPSYILLWSILVRYLTVIVGSFIFWRWLKLAEDREGANGAGGAGDSVAVGSGGP
jgi:uncharacterized protein (TIRG00374 family)